MGKTGLLAGPSVETVAATLREATERGATAASVMVGSGDKNEIDRLAVEAITTVLSESDYLQVEVVIGEGDKDEAPMLHHGAKMGNNPENRYDMGADPVEGTTRASKGENGASSVLCLTRPGEMLRWLNIHYTNKLAVGPEAAELLLPDGPVKIDRDPADNMAIIARHLGISLDQLVVAVLDRQRNQRIIDAGRSLGVILNLFDAGDINEAIKPSMDNPKTHMFYGSGGSPEAVLSAVAISCLRGGMQVMLDPKSSEEAGRAREAELLGEVLYLDDLVGDGEMHFSMTALTPFEDTMEGCRQDRSGLWQPGTTIYLSKNT